MMCMLMIIGQTEDLYGPSHELTKLNSQISALGEVRSLCRGATQACVFCKTVLYLGQNKVSPSTLSTHMYGYRALNIIAT